MFKLSNDDLSTLREAGRKVVLSAFLKFLSSQSETDDQSDATVHQEDSRHKPKMNYDRVLEIVKSAGDEFLKSKPEINDEKEDVVGANTETIEASTLRIPESLRGEPMLQRLIDEIDSVMSGQTEELRFRVSNAYNRVIFNFKIEGQIRDQE